MDPIKQQLAELNQKIEFTHVAVEELGRTVQEILQEMRRNLGPFPAAVASGIPGSPGLPLPSPQVASPKSSSTRFAGAQGIAPPTPGPEAIAAHQPSPTPPELHPSSPGAGHGDPAADAMGHGLAPGLYHGSAAHLYPSLNRESFTAPPSSTFFSYSGSDRRVESHSRRSDRPQFHGQALDAAARRADMHHKDVLEDSDPSQEVDIALPDRNLAPDMQVRRLTAQLTAAYNRIAALEEQLLSQRVYQQRDWQQHP